MEIETIKPIREQIADILRNEIIEGKLIPGEALTEREVSTRLNVSTTPVKEAFRILATEGLLLCSPRSKTMVSHFAIQSLQQVSLLRSAMEGVAASIAVANLTTLDIDEMGRYLDRSLQYIQNGDIELSMEINSKFHRVLREMCRNSYLLGLIETLRSFEYSFRLRALQNKEEAILGYNEHVEILRAVRDRDASRAEILLRDHIRRSSDYVLGDMTASKSSEEEKA